MRKGSIKNNRVSGEVRRELSSIISNDVKDPRITGLVSVTSVYVAPDLKTCKAYISTLGSKEELDSTIEGLKSAEGYIRRELARRLNLRNTPEITFIADESIAYGVNMTHRLEELVAQIPERDDEEDDKYVK
ncbi:MAG: 30S ribosome-binding factor RbfA [Lachnospiraceae bacterium]|nr:30S ribosome-binding factor RbfA [Lachnospiraceae bacterium]MBR6271701.1 30S ribosome-binding factor RbfA [Lachnospiraceae bacterium]